MKKLVTFLFALCALSASGISQQMHPIKFEEYDLSNGLHVILYPEHSAPVVATRVYYHVGSKNEDPKRTGFAHFFEHLMFEATDNIKREEYSKNVEQVGGNLNAFTANDETVYIDNLPSNYLHQALWGEAERMHWLHVDSIGVETQRQVVKEERRNRYENQPYGDFFLKGMQALFKGSVYEWTPIGDVQYIDQASIAEFQAFYHKYYVPNNAVLVVAGDFQTADAKQSIEKYFGTIPKGAAPIDRPAYSITPQTSEQYIEVPEKMTPLPAVAYAWRTVAAGDKDQYALDMLTNVLSQGNSSRFTKRLVDKDQIAVQVSAFPVTFEKAGAFGVFAVAKQGTPIEKVRADLDEEIANVQTNGITEEEFQKVRNQMTKQTIEQAASVEAIAVQLAEDYAYFHDTNRVNTDLANYMAVTKEDIQRVASEYLTKDKRTVLYYPVPAGQ